MRFCHAGLQADTKAANSVTSEAIGSPAAWRSDGPTMSCGWRMSRTVLRKEVCSTSSGDHQPRTSAGQTGRSISLGSVVVDGFSSGHLYGNTDRRIFSWTSPKERVRGSWKSVRPGFILLYMDTGPWEDGLFLERPNRFLAVVELGGEPVKAHVPDPGRLRELLVPDAKVRLRPADRPGRRTAWDLIGVECPEGWVNIDSRLPNLLFVEAVEGRFLDEFPNTTRITPEYHYGGSVLDFLLEGEGPPCLVEVKGCTLALDGVALFPDAPTARGARHLEELMRAAREGYRACAVFVVKHPGAMSFAAHAETDPFFAATLRRAASSGVEVIPYLAPWRGRAIRLERRLPWIDRPAGTS